MAKQGVMCKAVMKAKSGLFNTFLFIVWMFYTFDWYRTTDVSKRMTLVTLLSLLIHEQNNHSPPYPTNSY